MRRTLEYRHDCVGKPITQISQKFFNENAINCMPSWLELANYDLIHTGPRPTQGVNEKLTPWVTVPLVNIDVHWFSANNCATALGGRDEHKCEHWAVKSYHTT